MKITRDHTDKPKIIVEGWLSRTFERVLAGLIVASIYWLIR